MPEPVQMQPQRTRPKANVDVIVPCYNYGRFLPSCVSSVLGQQECNVRVLIIDDASTDDSAAVARRLAATDPRVEVRVHERNRGHIATYNEGIDWLSAEYMLLLSSDDMLAPGSLRRAIRLMDANPHIAFVHGTAIHFSDETAIRLGDRSDSSGETVESGEEFIRALCVKPDNPVETATAVVRTALQKSVGGYRPELPHAGDMEMWLRLAVRGSVGRIHAAQAFTRIHANNMRHGYATDHMWRDYEQRHRVFQMFFDTHAKLIPGADRLLRTAKRALAVEIVWAVARSLETAKDPGALKLLDLARAIDPSIVGTSLWWKTAIKRTAGPGVARLFSRALTSLRREKGPGGWDCPI